MPAIRRKPRRCRAPLQDLPIDVLSPILSHLENRRDWRSCCLVNKAFCETATPFLYRKLDSRILSKASLYHPSSTLLRRPHLAQYVRHVTETGAVHRGMLGRYPNITNDTIAALRLCVNLRSMTWIDDSATTDSTLLGFLEVIRTLPLQELTIRTHSDLGEVVWAQLISLTGLQKVSIWCMEGPPRVLQGWSGPLGSTLTHLELGRCSGVPPTILVTVLSQLPLLQNLRLKGAPASVIPSILTFLPNLQSLDTEYNLTGSASLLSRQRTALSSLRHGFTGETTDPTPLLPALRHLTVRTSSMDNFGPQELWGWIREITPHSGLETFRLQAFSMNSDAGIPRMFILDLAANHGSTLKHFIVADSHLTPTDIECLCSKFPNLTTLVCSVASSDVASITEVITGAKNLQTLKLRMRWTGGLRRMYKFTLKDATQMMLRDGDSKLRTIAIDHSQYTGKWVLEENVKGSKLRFDVSADVLEDNWHT